MPSAVCACLCVPTQLPPRELGTVQTTPIYEEREDAMYEQMETRVEEVVREALTREWGRGGGGHDAHKQEGGGACPALMQG